MASADKLELERLVPLGASIFRWINQYFILPSFNFFGNFIGSYGLIIFLLTLLVKIILFPLTYKSYMSSAKMRVLRPQVEEINALSVQFSRMLTELSIEKEQNRKLEMRFLLSQLNPHFLYNTLNSIYWMILDEERAIEACEMMDAL